MSCSKAQPASPNSVKPTIRALPFKVWNARRKVVCSAKLLGSDANSRAAASPLCTTSRASSRKISRKSPSSSSSSTASAAGLVLTADFAATDVAEPEPAAAGMVGALGRLGALVALGALGARGALGDNGAGAVGADRSDGATDSEVVVGEVGGLAGSARPRPIKGLSSPSVSSYTNNFLAIAR